MSVDTSVSYFSSAGDGTTVTFGYAAPLLQAPDLTVELVDATTGAVTAQVLESDYTVSIADDKKSASVTFTTAPPAGKNVVRRRNADYTQPFKLPANGPFPNDEVEDALDRVIMQLQAIRDTGNRALRLADSDPPSLAALPPLATLLNTYLFINGSGMPVGVAGVGDVPIAAAWEPVVTAATLALGLAAMGMSGYVQTLIGSASKSALQAALGINLRSYLAGLGTARNAGTPNTKIDVAAGVAMDGGNTLLMVYAGGTLDCGTTGAGGLDTGTLANGTWYHLFVIGKADGTTALLASTSISAPALPTGYTLKRRIASFLTDGSAHILDYTQTGDRFTWTVAVLETTSANPGTGAVIQTLANVPTGLRVEALFNAVITGNFFCLVYDLAVTSAAPSGSAAPLGTIGSSAANVMTPQRVFTNASAQIGTRFNSSGGGERIYIATTGWIDRRGRDD